MQGESEMNERIKKIKESVSKDEKRIIKLQDGIKTKKEKIKELENTELMNNLNSISAKGFDVNNIVEAIKNKDIHSLMGLMAAEPPQELLTDKSGTGSAFQKIKEVSTNE
jgi:hypothetical protein